MRDHRARVLEVALDRLMGLLDTLGHTVSGVGSAEELVSDFRLLRTALSASGYEAESAELSMEPTTKVEMPISSSVTGSRSRITAETGLP